MHPGSVLRLTNTKESLMDHFANTPAEELPDLEPPKPPVGKVATLQIWEEEGEDDNVHLRLLVSCPDKLQQEMPGLMIMLARNAIQETLRVGGMPTPVTQVGRMKTPGEADSEGG